MSLFKKENKIWSPLLPKFISNSRNQLESKKRYLEANHGTDAVVVVDVVVVEVAIVIDVPSVVGVGRIRRTRSFHRPFLLKNIKFNQPFL